MKSQYWSIDQLPGLSETDIALLQNYGIVNTKQLLEKANTLQSKQQLAIDLQINILYLSKWVALADLARIPDVGCEYCGLLLHSGIVSVLQLKQNPVHRVHRQIVKLQFATLKHQNLSPSVGLVQKWIQQATLI
jgi:Domain of unknown function (DUF4332)